MKRVLVTGATGALGRAVLAELARRNARQAGAGTPWEVIAGSRRASAATLALDVRDRAQVGSVVDALRPDLILHLAATLSADFDESYGVNVAGARHLCDAIAAAGHPTRLVLAGSAAEYGAVTPEQNPVRTHQPLQPVSLYGMTKAWQSMLGLHYARSGLDVVIARIFNLDGPGVSERLFAGRMRAQVASLRQGRQERLAVGPLAAVRDYVSLERAAAQLLAIAGHGLSGRAYHVGSGRGVSMRDFLRAHLAGEGIDFALVDEAAANSNRQGYDVPVIYADMADTEALLAPQGMDAQELAHEEDR